MTARAARPSRLPGGAAVAAALVLAACARPVPTGPSAAPMETPMAVPVVMALPAPARTAGAAGRSIEVVNLAAIAPEGLSALAYDSAGDRLIAVSDQGRFVTLSRGRSGTLTDHGRLGGFEDECSKSWCDAEAIAQRPDGSWLVAFEGSHRLLAYPAGLAGLSQTPQSVETPADWQRMPANQGIEALAVLADGRIAAFGEAAGSGPRSADHPLWLGTPGRWEFHTYHTDPGFAPTDAAVLPGGDLLILERYFAFPFFLSARLVLVEQADLAAGTPVVGHVVLDLPSDIPAANYEGLAVVAERDGTTVYLVADDNGSRLLRSVLVRISLAPGICCAAGTWW